MTPTNCTLDSFRVHKDETGGLEAIALVFCYEGARKAYAPAKLSKEDFEAILKAVEEK